MSYGFEPATLPHCTWADFFSSSKAAMSTVRPFSSAMSEVRSSGKPYVSYSSHAVSPESADRHASYCDFKIRSVRNNNCSKRLRCLVEAKRSLQKPAHLVSSCCPPGSWSSCPGCGAPCWGFWGTAPPPRWWRPSRRRGPSSALGRRRPIRRKDLGKEEEKNRRGSAGKQTCTFSPEFRPPRPPRRQRSLAGLPASRESIERRDAGSSSARNWRPVNTTYSPILSPSFTGLLMCRLYETLIVSIWN